MCLIAFAYQAHPRFPLVLVANRDEFHGRPSAALAHWDDAPDIVGGRDLKDRGGWLAVRGHHKRLAAVTNVREPLPAPARRSRGALVRDYLVGEQRAVAFAEQVCADARDYGPFNLLLAEGPLLVYATNRPEPRWETVRPGIHGLSNATLDAPWPKARRLQAVLGGWLAGVGDRDSEAVDVELLFAALAEETVAADADLPDTGVGIATERRLSPPFIRGRDYGTRAASIVLVDRKDGVRFVERSFGPDGRRGETREVHV